jgi:hypothetical protein
VEPASLAYEVGCMPCLGVISTSIRTPCTRAMCDGALRGYVGPVS